MRPPACLQDHPRIVLFDGVCRLCNGWSQFLLRHDRAERYRLCSVQSAPGQALLAWFGLPTDHFDTLVYIEDGKAYVRSEAILRILAGLPAPWNWARLLRGVPRIIRDPAYDLIARNRYRLFGRLDQCALPSAQTRARFIEQE
ncbi:MAG: hypothetical protein GAK43_00886 [Stenotrophomonas maltophilia]|nr:MAG: hypothetical protein GAK43_00886 [Stenotrophomonas maltophilia]